jgi:hypothetical protein
MSDQTSWWNKLPEQVPNGVIGLLQRAGALGLSALLISVPKRREILGVQNGLSVQHPTRVEFAAHQQRLSDHRRHGSM